MPGHTRDISSGGVRFSIQEEVPIGTAIEYIVTLSENGIPVHIRCRGRVLRCLKNEIGFEAAATMSRYVFVHGESPQSAPTIRYGCGCVSFHAPNDLQQLPPHD